MKNYILFVLLGFTVLSAAGQDLGKSGLTALPGGGGKVKCLTVMPGNTVLTATSIGNSGKLILTKGATSDTIRTLSYRAGKMAECRGVLSDGKGNVWLLGVFEGNMSIGGIEYTVSDTARYTFVIRTNEKLQMLFRDMKILRNFDGKFIQKALGDSVVVAGEFTGETAVPGLPPVFSADKDVLIFRLGPDMQPAMNLVVVSEGETRITAMASGSDNAVILAGVASANVSAAGSSLGYSGNGTPTAFLMMLPNSTHTAGGKFIGLNPAGDSTGIAALCHDAGSYWLAAINHSQGWTWEGSGASQRGSGSAALLRFSSKSFDPVWCLNFSGPGYVDISAVDAGTDLICACGSFTDTLYADKTDISGTHMTPGSDMPLRAFCCGVSREGKVAGYCSTAGGAAELTAMTLQGNKLIAGGGFHGSISLNNKLISSTSSGASPWLLSAEPGTAPLVVVHKPVVEECRMDTTFLISKDSAEAIVYVVDCHGSLVGLWFFDLKNGTGAGVSDDDEDEKTAGDGKNPAQAGTGDGKNAPKPVAENHPSNNRSNNPEKPSDKTKGNIKSKHTCVFFHDYSVIKDNWPGLPDSVKRDSIPPLPVTKDNNKDNYNLRCNVTGVYLNDKMAAERFGEKEWCDTSHIPVLLVIDCWGDTLTHLCCTPRFPKSVIPVVSEGKCRNLTVREAIICLSRELKGWVDKQQLKQDSLNARIKKLWSGYNAGNAMVITDSVNRLLALGKKSQATADSLKRVYIGKMCQILKKSPLIMASESLDPKFASGNITIDSVRWTPSDGGPTLFLKIDISAMSKYVQTPEGKKCNILNQVSFHCAGSGGYESRKGRLVCNQFMMDAGLMTTVIPVLEEFEKSDKIVFSDPAFYIMNCDTIPVKPKIVHYKTPEVVMYTEAAWEGLKEFGSTTKEGLNIVFSIYLAWLLREKVDMAIGVADYSTFVLSKLSSSFRLITGKSIESLTIFEDIRPFQSAINSAWDNYSVMKGTDKYKTKFRILLMKYLYDQANLLNSIKKEY